MPVATLSGVEVHVMQNYNIVSPDRPCPYVLLHNSRLSSNVEG